MFGPYLVTCEDCTFEERISCGETAQNSAESHSKQYEHAVCISDVNTGAEIEVGP